MKQKTPVRLAVLALCVFSVSCRSMLNYPHSSSDIVDSADAIIAGNFVSEKKHNEGDIVISGYLAQSAWSSFLFITGLRYKWQGTMLFSGVEQPLLVVTWSNPDRSSIRGLSLVSIREIPDSFICKDFNILSERPQFSRMETWIRITEFTLNGKKFHLELLPERRYQNMENHFRLLQSSRQTVQIVDENGKIYADFDMNSYRIYEQPPDTSIEQMQMAISVFSVVQHICYKLRDTVFVE